MTTTNTQTTEQQIRTTTMLSDWIGTPNIPRSELLRIGSFSVSELISQQEGQLFNLGFTKDNKNRWVNPPNWKKPLKNASHAKPKPVAKAPSQHIDLSKPVHGMIFKLTKAEMVSTPNLSDEYMFDFNKLFWINLQLYFAAGDFAEARLNKVERAQ